MWFGLSTQLRKLLVSPRDEDEFNHMKKIIQETINLTRVAIWRGLIHYEGSGVELIVPICENAMYKRLQCGNVSSMVDLMCDLDLNEWDDCDTMAEVDMGSDLDIECIDNQCHRMKNRAVIVDVTYVYDHGGTNFQVLNHGESVYMESNGGVGGFIYGLNCLCLHIKSQYWKLRRK